MSEPQVSDRVRITETDYDVGIEDEPHFKGELGTIETVKEVPDGNPSVYLYGIRMDNEFHGMQVWHFYGDEFETVTEEA